jgi:hypothetical protein
MYSARAYPNRLRPGTYRQLASELALQTLHYETTTRLTDADVDRIRPWLTERYAATPADDLATLDFVWLVSRSRAAG